MSPLRRLARPLLAVSFVAEGTKGLMDPGAKRAAVERVADDLGSNPREATGLGPEDLARITGGVQVSAGSLLALNRLPRLSAALLAASLVPSTAGEHRFCEAGDKAERQRQQTLFLKNLGLLGGLLIAAVDTEGRPGLGWRARHAVDHAEKAAKRTKREAEKTAKSARRQAKAAGKTAKVDTKLAAKSVKAKAKAPV
jgi:putative oxidoreductase